MSNEPSTSASDPAKPVPSITRTDSVDRVDATNDALPARFQNNPSTETIDPRLVTETKNQIRTLVQEIRDLAASDCAPEEFYQGFLSRTIGALASVGGAIWLRNEHGHLQLQYHANLSQTELNENQQAREQHALLLNRLLDSGQPTLIPPNSGSDDDQQAANPTQFLLVVGPLAVENEIDGLVEIFQRPGGGPTTQRGYLRFLVQMCEVASTFLKNQRLKEFIDRQKMWQQVEHFVRSVHQGLDVKQTIYTIANEGRRLIECDRVSVAMKTGGNCKIQAVSGLDSIERRAEQVKLLGRLATTVVNADQPLWYSGDDSDLPPQIEKRLQAYVDRSHSKMIAVLPLHRVDPAAQQDQDHALQNRRRHQPKIIGALIVEQVSDDRITSGLRRRSEVVQVHSCDALTNSLTHNSVFLMPLWRALGAAPGVQQARRIPKWTFAVAAIAIIAIAMCIVPYDFSLGANGQLVPESRSEVYAPLDGVLKEILVSDDPDAIVEQGELLARMTNNDLILEIKTLEGQLKRELEQQKKLDRAGIEQLPRIDQLELRGELSKSLQTEKSIRQKLAIKRHELKKLEIRSPARGQVVNWQLRQNLIRRPVKTGHHLMTVVDPQTEWYLEIEMPERRVEHMMRTLHETSEPLQVTFTLASHPGKTFNGTIVEIDRKLEVHSDEGNAALVRVAFKKDDVPDDLLRTGTRVTAKVHCGKRKVGYVLFHELIETVRSNVLFWF